MFFLLFLSLQWWTKLTCRRTANYPTPGLTTGNPGMFLKRQKDTKLCLFSDPDDCSPPPALRYTKGVRSYPQRASVAAAFHSKKARAHMISCLKSETNWLNKWSQVCYCLFGMKTCGHSDPLWIRLHSPERYGEVLFIFIDYSTSNLKQDKTYSFRESVWANIYRKLHHWSYLIST